MNSYSFSKILLYIVQIVSCKNNVYEQNKYHDDSENTVNISIDDIIPENSVKNELRGGSLINIREYPFVVSIQKKLIPRCVGSLISPFWVITAGHCLIDLNKKSTNILDPDDFTVISGRTIMTSSDKDGQERKVEMLVLHSRFQRVYLNYDVGLVKTKDKFTLNYFTQSVKLYSMPSEIKTYFQFCKLIGWEFGNHTLDEPSEANTKKLKMMNLRTMSFELCKSLLGRLITQDSVCSHLDGKCPGQSGSPLICGDTLYGIFTWTTGCLYPKMPAIFMRVAKIYIWVHNVTDGIYTEAYRKVASNAMKVFEYSAFLYILQIYAFIYF
ncbi:hypothetical protein HHI36_000969 [Cryptolaemus montrouzieri]|uniref:trypsin n=1 Tax=Cryptolaemus montrouzieri TaxID=559131 RepID=A0ABD2P6V4_9CUCU